MRKELFQIIEIPKGIDANLDGTTLTVKGPQGELKRNFIANNLIFEKEGSKIKIGNKKSTKKEKKMMNTIAKHIGNMIEGVQNKFEYKLKSCFSHFPFSVEIKGDEAIIKNFLGEKKERRVKIPKGATVKVDKEHITVTAIDIEVAGQASANLEKVTNIINRDRRIFQDGIFITTKPGRHI